MTLESAKQTELAIGERTKEILPSSTLAITAKAKALKAQGHPVISLAAGEPDFPTPEPIRSAIITALEEGFTKYTPTSGLPELKKAVASKISRDQGLDVEPAQVAISCGAKHSLYNIIQVLINPGDEVVIPCPYWVSYPEMVKLAGGKPVFVETSQNNFLMTADLLEKALTPKSRLVLLNSPSNPTGAVLNRSQLEAIARLLQKKNLFCISDEIYEYYVFDGNLHVSIAQLLANWEDHVAIVNGVSKSYAMTGLRIGYTVAHPRLIQKIGILQDHSTSNPTSLSQKGALAALAMDPRHFENLKKEFKKKRDLMMKLLEEIPAVEAFCPQGAFYVFASVKKTGLTPETFAKRLLEEKFVATIPGEGFGSRDCIRLSFATAPGDIEEGLKRMKEWASALK